MRRRTTAATPDRRTTVVVGEQLAWNCARMAAGGLNYLGTSYQSDCWENCRRVSGAGFPRMRCRRGGGSGAAELTCRHHCVR
eukprot:scaffold18096_cov23-Phaeocystis_antarctica.AAC.1